VEVRGEEGGDVAGYYGGAERSSASVGVEGKFYGQCWNLVAACVSEARAVAPRAPWSLRMLVHELVAATQ
jgi:hypothetical protein